MQMKSVHPPPTPRRWESAAAFSPEMTAAPASTLARSAGDRRSERHGKEESTELVLDADDHAERTNPWRGPGSKQRWRTCLGDGMSGAGCTGS
jgi:hypothetical protein